MLWLRAYKRELFDDKTFPEIFTNNEDIFAFPCLLHKANTVFILDKVLHKYNDDNEDSIMNFVLSNNDSSMKLFSNRSATLHSISHIKNYLGTILIEEQYGLSFKSFTSRIFYSFMMCDYMNLSHNDKLNHILTVLKLEHDEFKNITNKFNTNNKNVNLLFKFFGFNSSIRIIKLISKIHF